MKPPPHLCPVCASGMAVPLSLWAGLGDAPQDRPRTVLASGTEARPSRLMAVSREGGLASVVYGSADKNRGAGAALNGLWDGGPMPNEGRYHLAVDRQDPLATSERNLGVPSGLEVFQLAVRKSSLTVEVASERGSGLDSPERLSSSTDFSADRGAESPIRFRERVQVRRKTLDSAEVMDGADSGRAIVAEPDGIRCWTVDNGAIGQVEKGRVPQRLEIKLPD